MPVHAVVTNLLLTRQDPNRTFAGRRGRLPNQSAPLINGRRILAAQSVRMSPQEYALGQTEINKWVAHGVLRIEIRGGTKAEFDALVQSCSAISPAQQIVLDREAAELARLAAEAEERAKAEAEAQIKAIAAQVAAKIAAQGNSPDMAKARDAAFAGTNVSISKAPFTMSDEQLESMRQLQLAAEEAELSRPDPDLELEVPYDYTGDVDPLLTSNENREEEGVESPVPVDSQEGYDDGGSIDYSTVEVPGFSSPVVEKPKRVRTRKN